MFHSRGLRLRVNGMKNISISPVTLDDSEILWRWGEENWELWGDEKNKWFSKDSLAKWIRDPEDDVLLIARESGKPVGMCMTLVLRNWAFCVGLFVEPEYRNQKIGKRLLSEVYRRLKENNVESLLLLVDVKNEAAVRFYEREKFYKGYQFFMMTKDIGKTKRLT